jgi:GT2 family glycosyltransferase
VTRPLLPSATVLIATYNRPDYLRTCLKHLDCQTVSPEQTLVVDASSDHGTADVVKEFPGVVYLRNNRGPGSAATSRAIGLTYATSEIVAFIDDDAYAEPDWLKQLLRRYDDASVGAVGGRAKNGQPGEESEGISEIGLLLPDGRLTGYFAADPGRDVDVDHLLGANMSVRRQIVEELGGIHDYYTSTCLREETDIVLRIGRAGYRIVYTPEAVVEHVTGPTAQGWRCDTRHQYYEVRNHVVLLSTTLGTSDPHYRNYLAIALVGVAHEVRSGVRGVLGALARAAASTAGLAVGAGVGTALVVKNGRRRAAVTTERS